MKEDINKIKEKLKKELRAELYEETAGMFNRIYNQFMDLSRDYDRQVQRVTDYKEKCNKLETETWEAKADKKRWDNYYQEVCKKYAELEIKLDIANAKIELLKKEGE